MIRAVLTLVFALGMVPAMAAEEQPSAPKDMVLLTVSGLIGVLALQKVNFPKAFAFDHAMPLTLEQGL
jgi:hypothetical protein